MNSYSAIRYQNDGLNLYARDYPCLEAEECQVTVICLHGGFGNSANFHDLAIHLSQRYRVVVPDHRGRGESEYNPDIDGFLQTHDVRDTFKLIDTLDLTEFAIVGSSMGGLTATVIAALVGTADLGQEIAGFRTMLGDIQRLKVTGLIVNDIGPEFGTEGLPDTEQLAAMTAAFSTWDDVVASLKKHNKEIYPGFDDAAWHKLARELFTEKDGSLVRNCHPAILPSPTDEAMQPPPPMWHFFHGADYVPQLLLRGELSKTLTTECAKTMQEKHPDLTFIEVKGIGHCPMLSEAIELTAIDEFLLRVF